MLPIKFVFCVQNTLADFAPVTSPKIPALVIYCIKEIEHRGLHEVRQASFKFLFTFHIHVFLCFVPLSNYKR